MSILIRTVAKLFNFTARYKGPILCEWCSLHASIGGPWVFLRGEQTANFLLEASLFRKFRRLKRDHHVYPLFCHIALNPDKRLHIFECSNRLVVEGRVLIVQGTAYAPKCCESNSE